MISMISIVTKNNSKNFLKIRLLKSGFVHWHNKT